MLRDCWTPIALEMSLTRVRCFCTLSAITIFHPRNEWEMYFLKGSSQGWESSSALPRCWQKGLKMIKCTFFFLSALKGWGQHRHVYSKSRISEELNDNFHHTYSRQTEDINYLHWKGFKCSNYTPSFFECWTSVQQSHFQISFPDSIHI